jgi:spermidine/putrescine-binding protein
VTIPATSVHKQAAEQFINFLLRPEISAQMVNELWVATPNVAARPFIEANILTNPAIYPPNESLKLAEFAEPVSEETKQRYEQIWTRFLAQEQGPSDQPE